MPEEEEVLKLDSVRIMDTAGGIVLIVHMHQCMSLDNFLFGSMDVFRWRKKNRVRLNWHYYPISSNCLNRRDRLKTTLNTK